MISYAKERVTLSFPVRIVSFFVTLYIASIIVFKENYNYVTYFIDAILIISYIFLEFLKRDRTFRLTESGMAYGFFALFALFGALWAIDFDLASNKGMQLVFIAINSLILYDAMSKYHNIHNAFILGIFLGSFINYLFLFGLVSAPFEILEEGRAMGTLGNANVLSLTMVMSIFGSIIYLYKEDIVNKFYTYLLYTNIILAAYLILLTASKKGIVFGAILILVYLLLTIKDPKSLFRIGSVSAIAIVFIVNYIDINEIVDSFTQATGRFQAFETEIQGAARTGSTAERLRFIELGLSHVKDAPFIGHGVNTFQLYAGTYSHNNFVEILFSLGVIGLIFFYLVYLFVIRSSLYISEIHLKLIALAMLFSMIAIDVGRVSYDDKLTIYMLLFIAVLAERNSRSLSERELNEEKN